MMMVGMKVVMPMLMTISDNPDGAEGGELTSCHVDPFLVQVEKNGGCGSDEDDDKVDNNYDDGNDDRTDHDGAEGGQPTSC